jgi:hypothetical protein
MYRGSAHTLWFSAGSLDFLTKIENKSIFLKMYRGSAGSACPPWFSAGIMDTYKDRE